MTTTTIDAPWRPTVDRAGVRLVAGARSQCAVCGLDTSGADARDVGWARGNTERFQATVFQLWRCPRCRTIHSLDPVEMADIYSDYPLNRSRRLDGFARHTLKNLLRRLLSHGLEREHRILDYGCGNGVLVEFLRELGFTNVVGYDPYVRAHGRPPPPDALFDCVICNDVIEHCEEPRPLLQRCRSLVRSGGLLYVGTADAGGVASMQDLEPHLMRLHQPFHRVILTQESLLRLGREAQLEVVATFSRSYMDTLWPFASYRFLDEVNRALGHNLDRALSPAAGRVVGRRPSLLLYGLLGYFMPSALEPAVLWRRGKGG